MSLEQLSGHWAAVEGHGEAYVRTATAIEQAIEHLAIIRDEDETVARAFERVRDTAGEVSEKIALASSRYETTGLALVDYAEELRAAQALADEAIERWDAADAGADAAATERARLAALELDDGDADARAARIAAQQAVEVAQLAARGDAEAAWRSARDRKEEAAERAEARIVHELVGSALDDSFWDDVRGAISDCFDAVADALLELLQSLAASVLLSIAVLVAAALAIALATTGLVGLLLGGLALLVLATWVANGGAAAFVRTLVRTGSLEAALVAGVLAWAVATLPGMVDWLVEGDRGTPVLVWHGELPPTSSAAGSAGDRLARLQAANRAADAHAGGPGELDPSASTMITVTAVTTGSGTVYRVSIPSTQSWMPGSPSLNDIHGDAAAKLGTEPTGLELAVREAMDRAGVPEGASVLLSGWSLGGITAANLAADPGFAADFDIDAVIVAGASIDDAPVPTHIPVLAFEHGGGGAFDGSALQLGADPVPLTEDPAKRRFDTDPNRTVVRSVAPDGTGAVSHDGLAYQLTMQQQGDLAGSTAATWMALHDLDRYFTGVERAHASIFVRGR